jgi:hypothetical protein
MSRPIKDLESYHGFLIASNVVFLVRKSKISRTIRDLDNHLEFLIVSKDRPILLNLYRNITIIVSSMDGLAVILKKSK